MIYTTANKTLCLSIAKGCANLISYSSDNVDNKIYDAKTKGLIYYNLLQTL